MRYCHKKDGIEFYICTCPSWTARSTAGMDLAACSSLERAPLMAVMEDLSKESKVAPLSQQGRGFTVQHACEEITIESAYCVPEYN